MTFSEWLKSILGCQEVYWKSEANRLYGLCQEYDEENKRLKEQLNQNNQKWDEGTKPEWLDTSQIPYEPLIEIEGEQIKLKPQDIYMECPTLRDIAVKWRDLSLDQKLWEIWKFVIVRLTYKYDKNENWLPPIISYVRKFGDCEDGTILFVTLARLAHVPADSIFNGCGWYTDSSGNKFGHSFPIAKMLDDKWYIFETTIDNIPTSPKLFKGSNYDGSWGMANWKFAGKGPNQV